MPNLEEVFAGYWPHIIFAVTVVASVLAAVHAAMTKQDVRAAIGWVGIVIFSPLFGALLYFVAGINRIRRERVSQQIEEASHVEEDLDRFLVDRVDSISGSQFAALKNVGDQLSRFGLVGGNRIRLLKGGDETYPAMLEAIGSARHSVALQSYIFDNDQIGVQIAQALIDAQARGVEVRVLIDSVGSRYSRPPITGILHRAKVPTALFMTTVFGMRLAYANLRSHRKILIVDGSLGLTGGMNIRAGFMRAYGGDQTTRDTHFEVYGPIVRQLMSSFVHDWEFTTGEHLTGEAWYPVVSTNEYSSQPVSSTLASTTSEATASEVTNSDATNSASIDSASIDSAPTNLAPPITTAGLPGFVLSGVPLRCVPSGPDRTIGSTHDLILGALSVAQHHVRIQSPYFLPDLPLIAALNTAARRGVVVDIVIPGSNNLRLVSAAMMAQLDQLVMSGCRVWRSTGTFDHSKLMTIDGGWSYIGSSNLDPRSLRLNFELDIEVYDRKLAAEIGAKIDGLVREAVPVTLVSLRQAPFLRRLRNRVVWLASPYL